MRKPMIAHIEQVATILGVSPKRAKEMTSLGLAEEVKRGISPAAVDRVVQFISPNDVSFRNRIVPKATLARRKTGSERRLSPEESDKVARMASLWALALDVWHSREAAQRFLGAPHPLLNGRSPSDVAVETEIGARAVEELLGRLKYGSAP
jgi:putative toxin-antitoxin system antitoxin component (TIGR02293 family)